MRRILVAVGATLAGFVVACGATSEPEEFATREPVTPTRPAPTPAGPQTTITDGTWTVGQHIVPGKYQPKVPAGEDCYWAVLKSGTNGATILNNGIGGGLPTVTLAPGQDFETSRCGTWTKIR